MKKLMTTLALTAVLLVPLIMSSAYATTSATATGSVTIAGTCGVSLGSSTINYGTLAPGSTGTSSSALAVTNSGTASGLIDVVGGNWTDGTHDIILASDTGFSTTGIAPFTPLALHNAPVSIGSVAPSASVNTSWQLAANLLQPFAGSLTQQLTFSASC